MTVTLGAALFAVCSAFPNAGLFDAERDGDTALYEQYGEAVVDGEVPYRDFFVVYPPGALPVFVVPALAGHEIRFKLLQLLLGAATVALVVAVLDALGASLAREIAGAATVAAAAALTGVVAFGKVLSPQFLVWLVPALALLASRQALPALVLFGATLVVTQAWWPTRFLDLLELGDVVWLVLLRNVLLLALFALLTVRLREIARGDPLEPPEPARSCRARSSRA